MWGFPGAASPPATSDYPMPRQPNALHVVGARPNLVKVAPVLHAIEARGALSNTLVHTGQHYDDRMSDAFFRDLGIPPSDFFLGVGSGSHAEQTAAVLGRLEPVLSERRPDVVVVYGDVNSTLAAALAASKLGIPVAHVEAGLRSRDRSMPEEINRLLTDQLADLCLTPSRDGDENLAREGIGADRIRFVGNVMIDTLDRVLAEGGRTLPEVGQALEEGGYVLVTLHRPSNVDDQDTLSGIFQALDEIGARLPVVFPVHPRTRKQADSFGLRLRRVRVVEPVGYRDMLALQASAGLVLTDSGGVQEETTALGVPCLTLRDSTERPVTVTQGTNRLVPDRSREAVLEAFASAWGTGCASGRPEGWDGQAGPRVAQALEEYVARWGGVDGRR